MHQLLAELRFLLDWTRVHERFHKIESVNANVLKCFKDLYCGIEISSVIVVKALIRSRMLRYIKFLYLEERRPQIYV